MWMSLSLVKFRLCWRWDGVLTIELTAVPVAYAAIEHNFYHYSKLGQILKTYWQNIEQTLNKYHKISFVV